MGTHHLRERAKKLKSEGILIVRFEMMFNVWCGHCNAHIGKGVRYNAEKKKIGMYHTSPIYQFRMKCAECGGWMEIHTDPQNHGFKFVSGVVRKTEDPEADAAERGVAQLQSQEQAERLASDPMFRLEHNIADVQVAKKETPRIQELYELSASREEDYDLNSHLRREMRERKARERAEAAAKLIPPKTAIEAFSQPVLPATAEDAALAAAQPFRYLKRTSDAADRAVKRLNIVRQSIFAGPAVAAAAPTHKVAAAPRPAVNIAASVLPKKA